jgi:hypothetical protein
LFLSFFVGLAPVCAARTATYKDAVHGISLTYPSDMTMVTDQAKLSKIMAGAADLLNVKGELAAQIRQVGIQFMLLKKPKRAGDVTSNINFVVESTHGKGKYNLASYVKANMQSMQSTGKFKFTQKPTVLTVTGHPCETLAYELNINGHKLPGRQYYFYRSDKQEGFGFTVTGTDPAVTALIPKNLKVTY